MTETTRKKVSVCGSFGFGNAGDEAIPLAVSDMALHQGHSIDVQVISRFGKPALPDVIGLGPDDAKRLEALRGAPLLMSGGGIIENKFSSTIFQCAHLLKKSFASRSCLLGVSVEPGVTYGWRTKYRLWRHLRQFEKIYTRDLLSEATLNRILPSVKTETIGDLVLWLRPDPKELPDDVVLPKKFVAVVLAPRWSGDRQWLSWIALELQVLCRELGAALVFVPMTGPYDDDRTEHEAVIAEINKTTPDTEVLAIKSLLSPRAVSCVLGKADLVVSMRLHGCVMAYAQRTPCVGIVYHPKVMGFFRTVGWEHTLLPATVPTVQDDQSYGYRFSDLELKPRQLVEKAMSCHSHAEFSQLQELKKRSASALKGFLEGASLAHG